MACLWAGVSRIVYGAGRGEVSAVHFESRHANTIDYIRDAFRDDLAVEGNVLAAECMTLYSRRDEGREGAVSGSGPGIRTRLDDDSGYARDDDRLSGDSVPFRQRPGEGICSDADVRSGGEPVYGGLRVACDFRHAREQSEGGRGRFDLETGNKGPREQAD